MFLPRDNPLATTPAHVHNYLVGQLVLTSACGVHIWSCTVLDMGPDEIRQALAAWKRNDDERDGLVRAANAAAIPIREISQLSGLSRTTIYRILGLEEDRAT